MSINKQLASIVLVGAFIALTAVTALARSDEKTEGPFILSLPLVAHDPATGTLIPYASGLTKVTSLSHAGDGRLFAGLREGQIMIIEPGGTVRPQPFLDISDLVETKGWETGFLGLAFHPNFAANGYFYVLYSGVAQAGEEAPSWLVRYTRDPLDPNRADPTSAQPLLFLEQYDQIHKGGALHFGPDGYLYVALGESGREANAQLGTNLLGKILRLDVNTGDERRYLIPPDNPYVDDPAVRDEIWVYGLRNPWRFSFDSQTGDMYIADVGSSLWEEINFLPAGEMANNYGWNCYEGWDGRTHVKDCPLPEEITRPIIAYSHEEGRCAIIGGEVYRGGAFPELDGRYYYADFCSGDLWSVKLSPQGFWVPTLLGTWPGHLWSTFGQDASGELYLASYTGQGQVFRIVPND